MKKAYVKPAIFFESFTLSTNIAGDCEMINGGPTKGTCAYEASGGIYVFTDKVTACGWYPEHMSGVAGGGTEDQWDGFCYHIPFDTKNLFNS